MAGIMYSDTELALLGSIILEEKLIIKTIDSGLTGDDFEGEGFGFLFETMKGLYKRKDPIDLISLKNECNKAGIIIDTSTLTNMTTLSIPANIDYYIKQVKESAYKRSVYEQVSNLLVDMYSLSPDDIKNKVEELSKSISDSSEVKSLITDASKIKRQDLNGGLNTGFSEIDNATNGLVYGSLTILTGEPSSGKSTLLNQIIAENLMHNHKALIYSGELTGFNVLQWFMRTVANKNDLKEFGSKFGSYYDVTSHGEHLIREWIKNRLFVFNEEATASINNLSNTIEYLARDSGVKLIILDNMMTVENSNLEEYEKQKALTKRLKQLARKYEICVILVAHPKKKQNNDNKYHMHDVSGASEIVNLADYEFLLTRKIDVRNDGTRTDETFFSIMKNRITGKQGIKLKLEFDSNRKRFWRKKEDLNKNYQYDKQNQYSFVETDEIEEAGIPF